MMHYPNMEEVEAADLLQLARWHRFLPLPIVFSMLSAKKKTQMDLKDDHDVYTAIMDRICDRLRDLGGWTPELSQQVGWEG